MTAERRAFLDTNVCIYLLASGRKSERAEDLFDDNNLDRVISTQVVNEFVHVARGKLKVEWPEVREYVGILRDACHVAMVTSEEQDDALDISQRYGFAWYDSLIVASARAAGAHTLLSEDLQNGMRIGTLKISNPFA